MNVWDYIIAGLIAAAVVAAIAVIVRNKKRGKCSCGGDCSRCGGCPKDGRK